MLLNATVISLSVVFVLILVLGPLIIYWITHRKHKDVFYRQRQKSESYKQNTTYYKTSAQSYKSTYQKPPEYKAKPEYTYKRPKPPKKITPYEQPEPFFDTSLVNEIQYRMYNMCLYGKGEYLRKSKVKFTGSEEEWRIKNLSRGLDFEKKMEDEVMSTLEGHHLIRYKFQRFINPWNCADIWISWKGNKKINVIIIECKHSSNKTNKSLMAEEEQVRAGLSQLNRYQINFLKKVSNPNSFSVLLVLLIDFPIPFWEANYPFIFKDNVLFINYICFSNFLKSLDEVSAIV